MTDKPLTITLSRQKHLTINASVMPSIMALLKIILLAIPAIFTLGIVAVIICFWPVDSRLSGTFKSDKEETVKYLKTITKLTEKQLNKHEQIYGHFYYVFDAHKIKTIIEPYSIQSVFSDGSDFNMDASENESYFVMNKTNKDKVILFVLATPWWNLKDIDKIEIQFAEDGFWILPEPYSLSPADFKEKFTRVER
ncbi:MAG: hypothetical protein R6W72_07380 [Desulfurivibrionaceae bacterium]